MRIFFFFIERVELGLLYLHTNQYLVSAAVFSLYVLHFKEAIEDATESLDLINALHLSQLCVLISLPVISTCHRFGALVAPDRTASSAKKTECFV